MSTARTRPSGPDELGHLQAVEAVAAAHVADRHAGFDAQVGQHAGTAFLSLSHVADQPFGTRIVHRLGDLAPHVLCQAGGIRELSRWWTLGEC